MFDLKRLLTGLTILSLVIICYYLNLDFLLLGIISIAIIFELFKSNIINKNFNFYFIIFFFIVSINLFYFNFIIINFLLMTLLIAFSILRKSNLNLFFTTIILLSFILFIKLNLLSRNSFYLVILLSFINDTSALLIGKTLKGPKIIPKISPNKTWSGTLFSMLLVFYILTILNYTFFFSLLVSSSFFISDIYFSFVKRNNNLKDFSKILNSHGGVLDRLDSILIPSSIFLLNIYHL